MPTHDNGMVLIPVEWRDGCFLRYARTPLDLPPTCDGCGAPFSVEHGKTCKKGGLIIKRHDEIRDMLTENIMGGKIRPDI